MTKKKILIGKLYLNYTLTNMPYGKDFLIFSMNITNINIFPDIQKDIPEFYLKIIQAWVNLQPKKKRQII